MTYAESQTEAHDRQLASITTRVEALERELGEISHECEHAATFAKEECGGLLRIGDVPNAMRFLQINIRAQRQADAAKQAAALMRSAAAMVAPEEEQA